MKDNMDSLFLYSVFLFMFVLIPMVMILTITVNSQLSMFSLLMFGTPAMTVGCCVLAYWYFKHDTEWQQELKKKRNLKKR